MSDISISKAAHLSGKSQATIRRWAAQKVIPARKTENGKWVFNKDELLAHLSAHSEKLVETGTIRMSQPSDHERTLISAYEKQIKFLSDALERERKINDELRGETFKLTQEIKAILSKEPQTSPTRWIKTKVQEAFGI